MQKLREHGMLPSMSRPSNPYDNATCESFLKTLKREEIHASAYRDFEDLRERAEEFIERYYNECPAMAGRHLMFASKIDARNNVIRAGASRNQRWPLIDHSVPDPPGGVIACVAWRH